MSNEVVNGSSPSEQEQPNAVVVAIPLVQALLKYLDSQPRGAVNQLASALEQSRPVHVKQDAAPVAVEKEELKEEAAQ